MATQIENCVRILCLRATA